MTYLLSSPPAAVEGAVCLAEMGHTDMRPGKSPITLG